MPDVEVGVFTLISTFFGMSASASFDFILFEFFLVLNSAASLLLDLSSGEH